MCKRFCFMIFFVAILMAAQAAIASEFRLYSDDLKEGLPLADLHVLNGFGCEGGNQSPHLAWENPPAGTKSFVVTAYDPDAPTGSGWWHWVVFDIPADVRSLATNASQRGMPEGSIQSRTDFGTPGFGGACPPPGSTHRHEFRVYALRVESLGLNAEASPAMVGFLTRANMLDDAEVLSVFSR